MATLTFYYRKSSTNYSRSFTISSHRGLDDPDAIELWPHLQHLAADGSIIEQIKGFRRWVAVDLSVLQEAADRAFIFNFLLSSERWIILSPLASVHFALDDVQGFENKWKNDSSLSRYYNIKLREKYIWSDWPDGAPPTTDADMYIKTKVEVPGTEDSPTTFTTNVGALATSDSGDPYPAIYLVGYSPVIIIAEHQDCLINMVGEISQSGPNITFDLAHSDIGNAYPDGKFYATIAIALQAKS